MMVARDAVRDADLTRNQRTGRVDNWHSLTGRVVAIRISKSTMEASAGVLAQLVERLNGIEEVTGSNPVGSTSFLRTAQQFPAEPKSPRPLTQVTSA